MEIILPENRICWASEAIICHNSPLISGGIPEHFSCLQTSNVKWGEDLKSPLHNVWMFPKPFKMAKPNI